MQVRAGFSPIPNWMVDDFEHITDSQVRLILLMMGLIGTRRNGYEHTCEQLAQRLGKSRNRIVELLHGEKKRAIIGLCDDDPSSGRKALIRVVKRKDELGRNAANRYFLNLEALALPGDEVDAEAQATTLQTIGDLTSRKAAEPDRVVAKNRIERQQLEEIAAIIGKPCRKCDRPFAEDENHLVQLPSGRRETNIVPFGYMAEGQKGKRLFIVQAGEHRNCPRRVPPQAKE